MASNEPAADQAARNEFLWRVHSYINDYIRFADTKAQLTIGWSTAVAGALIAAHFYDGMVWPWPALARLVGLLALGVSIACAVIAVNPRLRTSQPKGYIYWNSVLGHGDKDNFVRAADSIGANEAGQHVANHIYDLASICRNKYWWVNLSILLAFAGSVLSGILFLYK
jgi:hypothetical protein